MIKSYNQVILSSVITNYRIFIQFTQFIWVEIVGVQGCLKNIWAIQRKLSQLKEVGKVGLQIIIINLIEVMALQLPLTLSSCTPPPHPDPPPIFRRQKSPSPPPTIEQFIGEWVDLIFLTNKRIDVRAEAQIYSKVVGLGLFELSSCSSVYELIRGRIGEISERLRTFLQLSFTTLARQGKSLCRLSEPLRPCRLPSSRKQDGSPANPRTVHPPLSRMLVLFYRFVCSATREVCNLWRVLYQGIQVKDLEMNTFQKSIGTFVLEVFTSPRGTWVPRLVLGGMSVSEKCRFICADSEGVARRIQHCSFEEDEMRRVLMERRGRRGRIGFNPEEFSDCQKQMIEQITGHLAGRRKEHHAQQKLKIDIPFIEQLKKHSTDNDICHLQLANLQQIGLSDQPLSMLPQCSEANTELLDAFQRNAELIYELEDTSSQEDDLHQYYEGCENYREDELMLQGEMEVECMPFADKHTEGKENQGSTKLSSSTGNEQAIENGELAHMKNYQFFIPPQFLLPDDLSCEEPIEFDEKREANLIEKQNNLNRLQAKLILNELSTPMERVEEVENNLLRCSQKASKRNQKYLRSENSKRYLQQQKLKLEKYRKQLEKEKEELLRQVQRFMKEKQRDECYYRSAANRISYKNHRTIKPICTTCKCAQELKHYDFTRFRHPHTHCLPKQEPQYPNHPRQHPMPSTQNVPLEQTLNNQVYSSMTTQNFTEIDACNDQQKGKTSKRQQKLRKKQERIAKENGETGSFAGSGGKGDKESVSTVEEKVVVNISEQQAQLSNFLQNLKIVDSNRTSWRVGEGWRQKWRDMIPAIRSKVIEQCAVEEQKRPGESGKGGKKKKRCKK